MMIWITICWKRRWIFPLSLSTRMIQAAKKLNAIADYGSILALSYVVRNVRFTVTTIWQMPRHCWNLRPQFRLHLRTRTPCTCQHHFPVSYDDHCRFRCERYGQAVRLRQPHVSSGQCFCRRVCRLLYRDVFRPHPQGHYAELVPRWRFLQRRYESSRMATYEKGLDEYKDENGNIIYG